MKNLELRSSLIKSGVLIGLCVFLIYAFAVEGSGGVGGTFSSLISGLLFVVGLAISLVISVIVIIAVYFLILYIYNKDVCSSNFEEFKESYAKMKVNLPLATTCCSHGAKNEQPALTSEDLAPLQDAQNKTSNQVNILTGNLDLLQKDLSDINLAVKSTNDAIASLIEKTAAIEEILADKAAASDIESSSKKLSAEVASVKTSMQPLTTKIADLEKSFLELSSDTGKDESIQAMIDSSLASLKDEVDSLKKRLAEPEDSEQPEDSGHRIMEYFTDEADIKEFIALVDEGVAQEMTYAQFDDFLAESLSKTGAQVVADHPSLTKDYIRDIRQKD